MKWIKQGILFLIGGSAYVGLELLYRKRSHVSMFAAGGMCFLLLGKLGKVLQSTVSRAVAGMLTITGVELFFGLLFNRDHSVWDYRKEAYHYRGQICPKFMLLWLPLSLAAMELYDRLDKVT